MYQPFYLQFVVSSPDVPLFILRNKLNKTRSTIYREMIKMKIESNYRVSRYLLISWLEILGRYIFTFQKWEKNSRASIGPEVGAYGDARMPNWPHKHHIPLPGIASLGLRRSKGGPF